MLRMHWKTSTTQILKAGLSDWSTARTAAGEKGAEETQVEFHLPSVKVNSGLCLNIGLKIQS